MPKELLKLFATVNIPQADCLVCRPTDKLPRIRLVEMDAVDRIAMANQPAKLEATHSAAHYGLVPFATSEFAHVHGEAHAIH